MENLKNFIGEHDAKLAFISDLYESKAELDYLRTIKQEEIRQHIKNNH